jgi:hypothetical protein
VVAWFKDDGYSAFKEIKRDDFVNLIEMIERDEIDVVIVRDVDRLTRNLLDWSRFEKAAIEHQVTLRRVQQAARHGQDTSAPRRVALLEEIRKAQEKRSEARRDWAEDTTDKADWLDIKQRTEARIAKTRKEYDKLAGATTVFGDIPASDMVRDAWESWNTDRRRAAVKAVLNRVVIHPATETLRDRERKFQAVRARTEFDWRF